MRFGSFIAQGKETWGLMKDEGAVLVDADTASSFPNLKSAIANDCLEEIGAELRVKSIDIPVEDISYLPVIGNPDKILCVGLNYHDHRLEGGHGEVGEPTIFVRFANAQIGHGKAIIAPMESDTLDFEAELAIIIGKPGRRIPEEEAFNYIAGYSCYNDGSVREYQRHTTQFTAGKNFMATGGFGPWMVTPEELVDLDSVTVESRLNGEVMQHAKVADMIFPIPKLINYISTFTELSPGDVIATGTPGGVGSRRNPQVWMRPGDVCEIEISGIGVLTNPVVGE